MTPKHLLIKAKNSVERLTPPHKERPKRDNLEESHTDPLLGTRSQTVVKIQNLGMLARVTVIYIKRVSLQVVVSDEDVWLHVQTPAQPDLSPTNLHAFVRAFLMC